MKVKYRDLGIARYMLNGLFATFVHFTILYLLIEVASLNFVWLANSMASMVAISLSFLGNRYFVFRSFEMNIGAQFAKFFGLYVLIAVLHGALLFFWSDLLGLDYKFGFAIAVLLQLILGFLANKLILTSDTPTVGQIKFWDRVMVRVSRLADPLLGYSFGKSILIVLRKECFQPDSGAI
ncbi:GtrA family protein [Arenicellales bacterium IMCC58067]